MCSITTILSLPGQFAGARNAIDLLLKDRQNAVTYNTVHSAVKNDLEVADHKLKLWCRDWHFQQGVSTTLAASYWGDLAPAFMNDRINVIASQLSEFRILLEMYRPSRSKIRRVLRAGLLKDVKVQLDTTVKSLESLEADSWKWLCQKYKVAESDKWRAHLAARHESYLLCLAGEYRQVAGQLDHLGEHYRQPGISFPYEPDLGLDLAPGLEIWQCLSKLEEISRENRIIHFVYFRPRATPGLQPINVAAQTRQPADSPPVGSMSHMFLEVELMKGFDHGQEEDTTIQGTLDRLRSQPSNGPASSWFFHDTDPSRTSNLFRFNLHHHGEAAAKIGTTDIALSELFIPTYAKIELAVKAAEMAFLFGESGLMDGLCVCNIREIPLKNGTTTFVFEVAGGSCRRACRVLIQQRNYGSLGVCLAHLCLGDDWEVLAKLPIRGEAQYLNEINKLRVKLEKIDWVEPAIVEAIISAMTPLSPEVQDGVYYDLAALSFREDEIEILNGLVQACGMMLPSLFEASAQAEWKTTGPISLSTTTVKASEWLITIPRFPENVTAGGVFMLGNLVA
ncbi:hypothetical protein AYL99_11195 [Fonsecaea erecta]|uniref:Uncharacterized protein n=1 Tax=Fonsecaea erecta TaxID=1367422 RepID=A0A178Z4S5_9EURO|nr:hypothetical protein AYL99_11195 [Fonsecaea erecta]OAP54747.1 hypothetical protein AYL99_11195 [Fonsecaea erecta]